MRIAAQAYEKDGQILNLQTGNDVDNRDTSDYRITLIMKLTILLNLL